MSEMPETPTLDKISKIGEQVQTIGGFIDWLLDEKKYVLCRWSSQGYWDDLVECPDTDTSHLMREFFGIDPKEEEKERRAVLEHIREQRGGQRSEVE